MEYFDNNNTLIAIHVSDLSKINESIFFTKNIEEFQVGVLNFSKEEIVKNHIHNPQNRTITKTSEVIYVLNGAVNVTLFDTEKNIISNFDAEKDSIIIFLSGGHGISFLKDTKLIEIKQGPYIEINDKEKF